MHPSAGSLVIKLWVNLAKKLSINNVIRCCYLEKCDDHCREMFERNEVAFEQFIAHK